MLSYSRNLVIVFDLFLSMQQLKAFSLVLACTDEEQRHNKEARQDRASSQGQSKKCTVASFRVNRYFFVKKFS